MRRHPNAVDGTYANRMVPTGSSQLIIGPHVIDIKHRVRTVKQLVDVRCCGTARHLTDPAKLVCVLGMEGEWFESNVYTLACRPSADLQTELDTECEGRVHFKDCHGGCGWLVVCNNEYDEQDFLGNGSWQTDATVRVPAGG